MLLRSLLLAMLCACGVTTPAAAANMSTIRIRIAGGSRPGSWQVRETRGVCSLGAARPGEWMVRYALPRAEPRALTNVQLLVPAARDVTTNSSQLALSVGFGPLAKPTAQYDVETRLASRRQRGSGSVKVTDAGRTAELIFDAQTVDGVQLRGEITCGSVDRPPAN